MIPKKEGIDQLKNFRPISLMGSFYKIIAKLLTKRLKKVIPKLVTDTQVAFEKRR